jgi:hypothetical protein
MNDGHSWYSKYKRCSHQLAAKKSTMRAQLRASSALSTNKLTADSC